MSRVPAFPYPRLWSDLRSETKKFSEDLQAFTSLHDSGRAALYWACRGLGLPSGAIAWLPSYHCGVEVDAISAAGIEVGFYRIRQDLTIDEKDLESKLKARPGLAMVIHYFGFPQPGVERIAAVCRRLGSVMIEDCAHALFSENLGSFAPVSFFSFRKTLSIYDGGALKIQPELLKAMGHDFQTPKASGSGFGTYALCAKNFAKRMLGISEGPLPADGPLPSMNPALEPNGSYAGGFSRLSREIARRQNPSEIVARRRRNYQLLDSLLSGSAGYMKVFPDLPLDTCPLFLPVWTSNRSQVMRQLRTDGIETFRFGAEAHSLLPDQSDPEGATLRNDILALPIHQALEESDMERIADRLRPCLLHSHEITAKGMSRAVKV